MLRAPRVSPTRYKSSHENTRVSSFRYTYSLVFYYVGITCKRIQIERCAGIILVGYQHIIIRDEEEKIKMSLHFLVKGQIGARIAITNRELISIDKPRISAGLERREIFDLTIHFGTS